MKMKAGPNPSLSSLVLPGGGAGLTLVGRAEGGQGFGALIRGRKKRKAAESGRRLTQLPQLERPKSCLGPQFPH